MSHGDPKVRARLAAGDVVTAADGNGDQQVDAAELTQCFRAGNLDRRQALRRLAIRHRHEWGDRDTYADFAGQRELAGLTEAERRRLYDIVVAPYVFWTDDLSATAGLPQNQTIYSYNAVTFLLELAARAAKGELPRTRGRGVSAARLEPRKQPRVPQ